MEELDQGLVRADITVTAAGLGKYLVEKEVVDRALRSRRYRPMLFLDGGLPNDIEPEVHDLGDAFVYTLDDLERVAQQGRMQREEVARRLGQLSMQRSRAGQLAWPCVRRRLQWSHCAHISKTCVRMF